MKYDIDILLEIYNETDESVLCLDFNNSDMQVKKLETDDAILLTITSHKVRVSATPKEKFKIDLQGHSIFIMRACDNRGESFNVIDVVDLSLKDLFADVRSNLSNIDTLGYVNIGEKTYNVIVECNIENFPYAND